MKIKAPTLRAFSVLVLLGVSVAGLACKTGSGTLCTFGYRTLSAICPLGAIEAMLASRRLLPWALVSLAVAFIAAGILGRIFCSWICPVPLVRGWLVGRRKGDGNGPVLTTQVAVAGGAAGSSALHPQGKLSRVSLDSRHVVLAGALLSTAIFGFPVFCLVCPVGLTFATVIGIWRLVQHNEPSWTLLVFPAVLVLELVVLRKWCRKLCPWALWCPF